jgi:peptidoglycan/LPS O-acetylase OafA/YrhL
MGLHKIIKIAAAALSILGIVFLIMIISKGDDAIKAMAEQGESSGVDYMSYIAYLVLGIVLTFVIIFVLKNMFSNKETLMSTIKGVGSFVVVALICYFVLAKGVETPLRDGEVLSASDDKLVGAGLYMFYLLALIACGTMIFFGLKKMIK